MQFLKDCVHTVGLTSYFQLMFLNFPYLIQAGGLSNGIRTKHPTDITLHVHFVKGGQKPPHVFLKADKTPHAQ